MRSKESETPCSKIPLFLIKKPILKTVSLLIVVLIELLISLFLFWSVIFKVYYLSFFAFSFSVLLIPVKLHDKKLWISRISALCILFLILNLTLWIPVKTIDHRIKELSDKYVYSKAYRELTIKDKIGIYGLNILMGLAAYPIYPEVSKETLYLIFPAPGDKIRVFDGRGFLGSWKIKFFYTTADLTSKVGRVWTLHVNSPVAFTVKLPVDATIISLSEAPTSIWTTNGHYFITMPAGGQEISYVIGVIGSKERAATLIDEAEQTIKKMKSEGVDTSQAQSKLDEAKTALEEGRYAEDEVLAKEAIELAEKESVKEVVERQPNHLWVFIGLASIGLVAVLLAFFGFWRRGKHKVERRTREIKVQEILEKRRHLRLEDREAIEFIASAGGEVFEAELREHFKLPKSTVWRMVKRLKREGLVEVEKVGGQNLIRLVDKTD